MNPPAGFGVFGLVLKWLGISGLCVGALGSFYAVMTAVQTRLGWGLDAFERYNMRGQLNKAALALLLASMFFVLAGSGLILIARPLLGLKVSAGAVRWPRFVARSLYVYSACTIALAVILVSELGDQMTSAGALAGLVTYCVLVGVGLLIASWGLMRYVEMGQRPRSRA